MNNKQLSALVYPYGEPGLSGTIKSMPEDFKVSENLGFEPSGEGEHLFLYVQKTSLTTHQLVEQLAKATGLKPRDIGYSGLKDKQAVTRQWISLHMPGAKHKPEIADSENYQILDAQWHDKKLRIGVHRSNTFDIITRDIKGQSDDLVENIDQIRQSGFANYFGEQRFGYKQDNVEQALRVLNNRHKFKRLSRNKKSLYISALRSELYNQILSKRIQKGIWLSPVEGDIFMLAGTQSIFQEPLAENIIQRYEDGDLHCAISLYGSGDSKLSDQAQLLEKEIIDSQVEISSTLLKVSVKRSLRANRALVDELKVSEEPENKTLRVQVTLEKGSYLTTLLNHFVTIN